MNTQEVPLKKGEPRKFQLEFEKVSDAPKPRPLSYTIKDLSAGDESRSHWRQIIWGKGLGHAK